MTKRLPSTGFLPSSSLCPRSLRARSPEGSRPEGVDLVAGPRRCRKPPFRIGRRHPGAGAHQADGRYVVSRVRRTLSASTTTSDARISCAIVLTAGRLPAWPGTERGEPHPPSYRHQRRRTVRRLRQPGDDLVPATPPLHALRAGPRGGNDDARQPSRPPATGHSGRTVRHHGNGRTHLLYRRVDLVPGTPPAVGHLRHTWGGTTARRQRLLGGGRFFCCYGVTRRSRGRPLCGVPPQVADPRCPPTGRDISSTAGGTTTWLRPDCGGRSVHTGIRFADISRTDASWLPSAATTSSSRTRRVTH